MVLRQQQQHAALGDQVGVPDDHDPDPADFHDDGVDHDDPTVVVDPDPNHDPSLGDEGLLAHEVGADDDQALASHLDPDPAQFPIVHEDRDHVLDPFDPSVPDPALLEGDPDHDHLPDDHHVLDLDPQVAGAFAPAPPPDERKEDVFLEGETVEEVVGDSVELVEETVEDLEEILEAAEDQVDGGGMQPQPYAFPRCHRSAGTLQMI